MSLENQRVVEEFPRPPAYFNLFENTHSISAPSVDCFISSDEVYDVLYDGYFSQAKLPYVKPSVIQDISELRSNLVNESKNILNVALGAIVAESDDEMAITHQFMRIHSSLQAFHTYLAAHREHESKCKLLEVLTTKLESNKAEELELRQILDEVTSLSKET
jgi:hypothetical protein